LIGWQTSNLMDCRL